MINFIQPYFMPVKALISPGALIIEPTNACDQYCTTCPTGSGKSKRPKRNMSFEEFKMIVTQGGEILKSILLCNYGEPFLNRDIYKMIEFATNLSVYVSTITNGSFLCKYDYKECIEKIIENRLNKLVISLDGMDQQTISKFRSNINIEDLKKGLEELIKMKNKTKNRLPIVVIQFIVMKHNEQQIELAKKYSKDINADYFLEKSVGIDVNDPDFCSLAERLLPYNMQLSRRPYFRDSNGNVKLLKSKLYNRCSRVYTTMTINSDGMVVPCCYDLYNEIILGNAFEDKLLDIWNGKQYREFRKKIKTERDKISICNRCNEFRSHVSKEYEEIFALASR